MVRGGNGGLATAHLQLATGILNMKVDGAFSYAKDGADLPAGFPQRSPMQAFEFAPR